jgi:flagellar biosynthetic protein FliP
MLITMVIGMIALHPVWHFGLQVVGASRALDHATVMALVMATDMSLGMGVWMRYRGHGWGPVAEMSAVMYVPFVPFLPAVWGGVMSGAAMLDAGHLLMLPAMLGLMVWRREQYGHESSHTIP